MSKKWIGVVSKEHVARGLEGSFACVCHGKERPISKLKKDDWLIYYSPTTTYPGGDKCQAFTGIGKVISGKVYQMEMYGFKPYAIDMEYMRSAIIPMIDIKHKLEFTQGRSWGMRLRAGLFELSEADFAVIQEAMCDKLRAFN